MPVQNLAIVNVVREESSHYVQFEPVTSDGDVFGSNLGLTWNGLWQNFGKSILIPGSSTQVW